MERNQFTFYISFYKTIQRIKGKVARAEVYDAICAYAFQEVLPDLEAMPPAAAIAFEAAKPVLDAGRRKAGNAVGSATFRQTDSKPEATDEQTGSERGATGKQTGSKPEATDKQTGNKPEATDKQTGSEGEKEYEKEKELETENKNKCSYSAPPYGGGGKRRRKVPTGSAGTAPLGELERAALTRMLEGVKHDA